MLASLTKKHSKNSFFIVIVVFIAITCSFLFKLNYHYFFTDEILYVQKGAEHLSGIYEDNLQVSPFPKYITGFMYLLFGNNVFLLRLPFALMGVITSIFIFLILKKEYGTFFGITGAILYATSRIIFDATRMAMLEPIMHLFWIFFHYYYFQALKTHAKRLFVLSGIFLGLSLLTKLTSIVLIPFTIFWFFYQMYKYRNERNIIFKRNILMIASSVGVILLGYVHMFLSLGFVKSFTETLRAYKDVYFARNEEGKIHIIGGRVYAHSPWWTYFYYHYSENGIVRSIIYALLAPVSLALRNIFVFYWALYFVLSFGFLQVLGIKNERYISSIEIPLIMLAISGLFYLYKRISNKILRVTIMPLILLASILNLGFYLYRLQPTEYFGLYLWFKNATHDFQDKERIYVFGSVRSMKWYREMIPNQDMFIYRKDYEIMCPEFNTFKYFAFDKEEVLKYPKNTLYEYVRTNIEHFERLDEVQDMELYKRTGYFDFMDRCPKLNCL